MTESLWLCLALNIWCAALLADFKGRQDTSCQYLVRIVREGTCELGPVQLIISWGMRSSSPIGVREGFKDNSNGG